MVVIGGDLSGENLDKIDARLDLASHIHESVAGSELRLLARIKGLGVAGIVAAAVVYAASCPARFATDNQD